MDLILRAHRKVSSGRSPNTLCIIHHTSHREERREYMGTMTEIFKPLEPELGKLRETCAPALFLGLLACPIFLFCPPHTASLLEGT